MKFIAKIICAALVSFIGFGCNTPEIPNESDTILARVFKHKLMASDIEGMFADSPSPQDSALLANSFVEKWVRENLLMQEAEKKIPKDLNIDELVRNYRSSLIKHNYEKLIIELQLDSTVTKNDINAYYDLNKEQFKLEYPLYQINHMKIPSTSPTIAKVRSWWNSIADSTSFNNLEEYCEKHADYYSLEKEEWMSFEQMKGQLPANFVETRLKRTTNLAIDDNGMFHLIAVKQKLNTGAIAPISHIKDKAERVILHTRKIQLIADKKDEMFDREIRLKNIEIYKQ